MVNWYQEWRANRMLKADLEKELKALRKLVKRQQDHIQTLQDQIESKTLPTQLQGIQTNLNGVPHYIISAADYARLGGK